MKSALIVKRHATFSAECLSRHQNGKPFTPTLSTYLKSNKSFGSRDRRRIRAMCYAWFRLGHALEGLELENQILLSYLCLEDDGQFGEFQNDLPFQLSDNWTTMNLLERLDYLEQKFSLNRNLIFPDKGISSKLDVEKLRQHQFQQPLLWLSVSEENRKSVKNKLDLADVEVQVQGTAMALPISTPVQSILKSYEFEIQDYSSQMALKPLEKIKIKTVWDCCAGSGGKSLLMSRNNPKLDTYASDIRPNILQNLKQRFKLHRRDYCIGRIDMVDCPDVLSFVRSNGGEEAIEQEHFDLVLVDVPCTGSGTWNRNPEHVVEFKGLDESVTERQEMILKNAYRFVKSGGYILYLTCSVFEAENEGMVSAFIENSSVKLMEDGYIKGYEHKSDTMYFALLQK